VDNPVLHRKLINRFQKFINTINIKSELLDCKSNTEILNLMTNWENQYLSKESL